MSNELSKRDIDAFVCEYFNIKQSQEQSVLNEWDARGVINFAEKWKTIIKDYLDDKKNKKKEKEDAENKEKEKYKVADEDVPKLLRNLKERIEKFASTESIICKVYNDCKENENAYTELYNECFNSVLGEIDSAISNSSQQTSGTQQNQQAQGNNSTNESYRKALKALLRESTDVKPDFSKSQDELVKIAKLAKANIGDIISEKLGNNIWNACEKFNEALLSAYSLASKMGKTYKDKEQEADKEKNKRNTKIAPQAAQKIISILEKYEDKGEDYPLAYYYNELVGKSEGKTYNDFFQECFGDVLKVLDKMAYSTLGENFKRVRRLLREATEETQEVRNVRTELNNLHKDLTEIKSYVEHCFTEEQEEIVKEKINIFYKAMYRAYEQAKTFWTGNQQQQQ